MGAFCIYGISYSDCLAVAEKKVSATEFVGKDEWRNLSLAEWAEKRDRVAKELFENGTRLTRVSPEFDAPQFCKDWLAINPANVRNAELRVWGGKKDANGEPVLRKGKPVITWVKYEGMVLE